MGKVVRFQGKPWKPPRQRRLPRPSTRWIPTAAGAAVVLGLAGMEFGPPLAGCDIKGNINRYTGERIYHVPGQEYYRQTRVNLFSGERWFCSEVDAQAAGWRMAMR